MNRNISVLALSGLTVAIVTGVGYAAVKRIREKQEVEESEETQAFLFSRQQLLLL